MLSFSAIFLSAWFLPHSAASFAGYSLGFWAKGEHRTWILDDSEDVSATDSENGRTRRTIGSMSADEISGVFEDLKEASLGERVDVWSALFLGTPYYLDPLGEGYLGERDVNPLLDFTRVDCLTYVEQVMALAFSDHYDEVLSQLLKFRYREGKPKFKNRYYTMVKGWILAHIKAGRLEDVTRSTVSDDVIRTEETSLRPRSYWERQHRNRFKMLGKWAPRGTARIDYIPISHVVEEWTDFPVPALMHIVSEMKHASPYLITHTGLLIKKDDGVYFRHASRSPERLRVEDRAVKEYLETLRDFYEKEGRRRVLGVNITRIVEPGNRNPR